ncbi:bifunctional (p)ppGpp synthetase/guanosine-3',5'-bis(diphosphate) 3'-pyrophosphohydrolase [Corynebacterium afermentans subsp. lipophilum]|uniref:HD domain-containing protein n=1 Tax=Corynebacterium afermentans TaxID=38286 RepID=UPI001889E683|nr:HD domain-containing protein [Corynebacterium afermentans]MBF4548373.1 bifunctional (p)ppGpp synthetase/guanosine-3',5'-bis(diphosphate) 3'-pyrophosphohydrolase [Corynebacterium afermentans subsp. lipophilum]WJY58766.1 Bifunctional (p)ppGpp synthase/hydrolase SpoT [Corynebacterium afermentans subsp. lipophilum]
MTNTLVASPRLIQAINTAAWAHRDHVRKGTDIPYVSHVFGVMQLVSQVTDDEDVLIAALFHDILEDVPEEYSPERMTREFGERVVELVRGVTKDSTLSSWQERADAYLAHLRKADDGSVVISAADKLHNLLSIHADLGELGDDLWARFNSGKERQLWWYRSVADLVLERLPGNPLGEELARQVERLENRGA